MRRRRNADAPITDAVTGVEDSLTASDPSLIVPAETVTAGSPTAGQGEDPSTQATAAAETEAPKPARRRSPAKRKTAEEPTLAIPDAPVAEEPVVIPEPVTAVEEAVPVADAPKPRAPRRRRTPAAVAPDETEQATSVPVADAVEPPAATETVVAPEPEIIAPVTEPAPAASPRRRGNLRRRAAGAAAEAESPASTEPTVAETAAASTPPDSLDAPAAEVAEAGPDTADSRSRRSRGGRRRRTSVTSGAEAATSTDSDASVDQALSDEAETAAAATEARRVRGLRRTPAAGRSATTAPRSEQSTAPSEPLLPAYQPLPDDVLARLAETRIVVRKNVPELVVNAEPRLPLWFFVNTEEALYGGDGTEQGEASRSEARQVAERQIRLAYEAGIRFFTVLAHLPWRTRSGDRRYGPLDDALQFITDNAPDAFILPRLIFSPPASWERAHPDQMTRYADGESGDISLASRSFWDGEADEALRAAVEHVAQGPHAGRVFGFYLEHGEWFYEKGRGYDVSEANTVGFRAWLRTRYKNSLVSLRAAWYDGEVTFETASIPPPAAPPVSGSAALSASLFFSDREQRYVDFHEYASDIVAQVITKLGKAVKEASGGRSAVAVSYGYTLELARAYSGHLALATVLASPNIDILTGPVSYSGRTPGGSAPLPAPIDSISLAGKLWISEDDTKSFLAHNDTPDTYNTKIASFEGTWAAYARNFAAALTRGGGVSWMDLWGTGWLDDRELWQRIGRLRLIAEALATRRRNPRTRPAPEPDVAVIVDERSFFDVRSHAGRDAADDSLLGHLIAQQRDSLLRSGARIGFYLLSDLLKKNFPSGPRLLIFLNAFRLPDAIRTVLRERFHDDGRTLAWVYGPGARETNLSELTDVIGMQLRPQPWGSKMGTQVLSNTRSPLVEYVRGQRLGEEVRVNPSFYAADPKALLLGEYAVNGNPSIAYRKHARWQSVFIGEMTLPIPLLRGLYRLAGVPCYTVDDDVACVGDNIIGLHSAPGGGTIVYLPEEGVLYDLLTDETLATDGWGARLSMPPRGTRLLFWGAPAEITRLGGDPKAGPPGLTRAELPAAAIAFAFETGEPRSSVAAGDFASQADISAEDEALMEAALAGEIPAIDREDDNGDNGDFAEVVDIPAETVVVEATTQDSAEEAARKKRRRRRRRGRGRNGAETDDASSEGTEISDDGDADSDFDDGDSDEDRITVDSAEFADGEPMAEFAPPIPAVNVPRTRPSLEELLPQSVIVDDGDLPPIPDEFLPLSSPDLNLDPSLASGEGEADTGRRRRRGGGRPRSGSRSLGGSGAAGGDSSLAVERDLFAPDAAAEPVAGEGDGA